MLAYTPYTREVLSWFQRTHEVDAIGMGGAVWRLRRLPQDGGLGIQQSRLMDALSVCRGISNHLLSAQRPKQSAEAEHHEFHKAERAKDETIH